MRGLPVYANICVLNFQFLSISSNKSKAYLFWDQTLCYSLPETKFHFPFFLKFYKTLLSTLEYLCPPPSS